MKLIKLMTFLIICQSAYATEYYVAANGDDSNSGTSPTSPWKTISKVNSFTFIPGDKILFNRGDEFYGGIVVSQSGNQIAPITYGAYGSGVKPIITGFKTIESWTYLGGNVWESSEAVSILSYTNMVTVNGLNTPMGRYPNSSGPNTGYLTIRSHSGNVLTTDDQLIGPQNWKGADIIIRREHYSSNKGKVVENTGNKLAFSSEEDFELNDGFGFFIQNDPETLDKDGEWYYNSNTKKIRIYSLTRPQDVRVATIENLFFSEKKNYIVIQDISFVGSNSDMINCIGYTSSLKIKNNDISFSGGFGIYTSINYATIENNKVYYTNGGGIKATERFAVIRNNEIKNAYLFEGMSLNKFSDGIQITNENSSVEGNSLDSCGFIGVRFGGSNSVVKNNFIKNICLILDDGGGIYIGSRGNAIGSIVDGNIILNAIGAPNGTRDNAPDASGIMIDAWSKGITIVNNTTANCANVGIKIHGTTESVIRNNTTYNNGGTHWTKGGLELLSRIDYPVRNLTIENNVFFAKTSEQYAMFGSPDPGDLDELKLFGKANNNYYAKPIDSATAIRIHATNMDVVGWSTYSGQDKNSKGAPKAIKNVDELRFEYNATSTFKTITLDANYIDVKGVVYNGIISLAPYSSVVLIRNGKIIDYPPVANAGSDQIITLPDNSVTLNGSGSSDKGKILSFKWSKKSGPSNYKIENTNSANTRVTGLTKGIYEFELTVTDDKGITGSASVKITVNPAPNKAPLALTDGDQSIFLPTNSVLLNGSGLDEDGVIEGYNWKKISGPESFNIEDPNSPATLVSNLIQGTYQFELTVTDDQGATGSAVVNVTVKSNTNQATNKAPVANAGSNLTITLPDNSVTLSGSATDADGTIESYFWTKIAGPSGYKISKPESPVTDVTSLTEGIYQFQLKVTDNGGATGLSVVKVTVNPKPNKAPVANAGANKTIILPNNTVSLKGSGSDEDGKVVSYQWTRKSGPAAYSFVNAKSPVTDVSGLTEGIYLFELTVTDDKGAKGAATVTVTVLKQNQPPIADAGEDQTIVSPQSSTTLIGKGEALDGAVIAKYLWTQLSGPSNSNIELRESAQTVVSGLVSGNYVFVLTVTDSKGVVGTDTMNLMVGAPRIDNRTLEVNIYPNPTRDFATLEVSGMESDQNMFIFITDNSGKVLSNGSFNVLGYQTNREFLDFSNYPKGLYFITIQSEKAKVITSKEIVVTK